MSLFWYDFETFGADPFRDRPCQFAGIRTDHDFRVIDDPVEIYCQPAGDVLPHPEACLITGITPDIAQQNGVVEAEFIARIQQEFSQPNTCVLGYNSIRFDDEVTRNTLYRNFHDPYAREWQNGNSRWDIIDVVRLARAVRPEGINWPDHEDGRPSFKLEHLTAANDIEQVGAHDALVDVRATIEIARLLKTKQPRLYEYAWQHRDKRKLEQQLNPVEQKPVLHISSKYPAEKGCAAVVVPVARDAVNKNAIYVYDLMVDPQPLFDLTAEQLNERIFTASAELPEGVERIPLKAVTINKCPIVVPAKMVDDQVAQRLSIDVGRCLDNLAKLKAASGVADKVREAFSISRFEASSDPDLMIYSGGFFSTGDRRMMEQVIAAEPAQLAGLDLPFRDARLPEMLFRYRARNFPQTLSDEEQGRWQEYRRDRLTQPDGGGSITLEQFFARIAELKSSADMSDRKLAILSNLESYGRSLSTELGL